MNERLEERRKQLLEYLNEKYKEHKPQKWWQSRKPVYKTTLEFSNTRSAYRRENYQEITRNDFKGATFTVAFLFFMSVLMLGPWNSEPPDLFSICFILVIFIASMLTALDRKPKVIADEKGLWTHKWKFTIPWDSIIASYIKIDDRADTTSYELIVHYYNSREDLFYEANYMLESLEVSSEAIAAYIEYWKMKTQNNGIAE